MNSRLMERWIESGSEITRLSVEGTATYWTGAVARGAMPWDVFDDVRRWWTEASRRERPAGTRRTTSCSNAPVARLRDFSQGAGGCGADARPPAAGGSRLVHRRLLAEQSQMKVIRAAGLERASRSNGSARPPETRDAGVEDYLSFVERSIGTSAARST